MEETPSPQQRTPSERRRPPSASANTLQSTSENGEDGAQGKEGGVPLLTEGVLQQVQVIAVALRALKGGPGASLPFEAVAVACGRCLTSLYVASTLQGCVSPHLSISQTL